MSERGRVVHARNVDAEPKELTMPLGQNRAALLDAVCQAPHQVPIVGDTEGVLHQLLYTPWDGWTVGCEHPFLFDSWTKVRYGKPSCLECLAQDKPDPKEVGASGRVLKLYHQTKGNHVHCVMFTGSVNETLANIGGFTALAFEWRELRAALVLGCKALGMKIELEEADV